MVYLLIIFWAYLMLTLYMIGAKLNALVTKIKRY